MPVYSMGCTDAIYMDRWIIFVPLFAIEKKNDSNWHATVICYIHVIYYKDTAKYKNFKAKIYGLFCYLKIV